MIARRALPAVVLAAVALPAVPLLDLPDPMAIHWSTAGPDGAAPRWLAAAAPAAVWGVVWWFALRAPLRRSAARVASGVGALLAVQQVLIVVANAGAASWREARDLPAAWIVAPAAAGLAVAWIVGRLLPVDGAPVQLPAPAAGVGATERVVWTGRAVNPGAGAVALLAFVPLLGPALGGGGSAAPGLFPLLAPAMVLAALAALFTVVRVVVGPHAVIAGLGPWAWPRRRIPMSDIRSASAEMIEPMSVGGWGYRMGPDGPAIVIRRGEALVLHLAGGRRLTVTVDGADEAASLVNAYVPLQPR